MSALHNFWKKSPISVETLQKSNSIGFRLAESVVGYFSEYPGNSSAVSAPFGLVLTLSLDSC